MPWTRLPALRALAPEFYDTLPSHPSWPLVIVNFIRDTDVGMFARVKRVAKEGAVPAAKKGAKACGAQVGVEVAVKEKR